MDNAEEIRKYKVVVRNPGGNASSAAQQYRLNLPTKWMKTMGVSPEERDVSLSFNGSKITIKKYKE